MTQPTCSSPHSMIPPRKSVANFHCRRGKSILIMLLQRELSPKAKFVPRKRGSKPRGYTDYSPMKQTGQNLISWVEAESLQHLSAKYCPLGLSPVSTIAAAFSSDGKTLASTHGDHTVKIIDFETGNCLKVLRGHHRTPWVVRFHPQHSEIVASGSLDQNVRLWNATTSECIRSHEFYQSISSIAFHAEGELLAVASGHRLHMWHYDRSAEESTPVVVLKTRRSLRAIHFHPHGAPFLLTAEVSEIDPLDSSMSIATCVGYVRYPPPAIYFTSPESRQDPPLVLIPHTSLPTTSSAIDGMNVNEAQTAGRNRSDLSELGHIRQLFQLSDQVSWELPFLQGWLMAQGHGVSNSVVPRSGVSVPNRGSSTSRLSTPSLEAGVVLSESPGLVNLRGAPGRRGPQEPTQQGVSSRNTQHVSDAQPVANRVQSEFATSLAAAAASATELPCTVKLRVWRHDIRDPYAQMKSDKCLLTIPHVVLCSEMGAHFSPCGKYLAACVACVIPQAEIDPGLQTLAQHNSGVATSPTQTLCHITPSYLRASCLFSPKGKFWCSSCVTGN